jgi:hypothetical protein
MNISKLWERIPFPSGGTNQDMVCWIINTQEQTILRLQAILLITITTFLSIIVSGKVYLGWF